MDPVWVVQPFANGASGEDVQVVIHKQQNAEGPLRQQGLLFGGAKTGEHICKAHSDAGLFKNAHQTSQQANYQKHPDIFRSNRLKLLHKGREPISLIADDQGQEGGNEQGFKGSFGDQSNDNKRKHRKKTDDSIGSVHRSMISLSAKGANGAIKCNASA